MTRLIIALPLAFFFGACDTPETTPNDDAIAVADDEAGPADGEKRGRGGKFAKLDADKDGTISQAEAQAHPKFAERFAELDADKDGKLTREEMHAMKGKFGKHGKHGDKRGDWGNKTPAERAAHKLEKYDSNGDKVLTRDEVEGSKFADKFVEVDTDKDGKLTLEEITAAKAKHQDRRGGPGHDGEERHGKRGDHDGKGWHDKTPEERTEMIFTKLDANADSVISREEVEGHRFFADKFATADADGDGKLTKAELAAFKPKHDKREAPAVR